MTVTLDSREPHHPHPWAEFLPRDWRMERGTLETGDVALAALPLGVTIERKTVPDFLSCVGSNRERFTRELQRGRYLARLLVIVEGSLPDVLAASRGISHAAILGTVSAWSCRFGPILFAGSTRLAAELCWRALSAQIRDIQRQHAALTAPTP